MTVLYGMAMKKRYLNEDQTSLLLKHINENKSHPFVVVTQFNGQNNLIDRLCVIRQNKNNYSKQVTNSKFMLKDNLILSCRENISPLAKCETFPLRNGIKE